MTDPEHEDEGPSRSKPSAAEVEKALQTLLGCPDLLERLLLEREIDKKRRSNWSKLSNSAYYNKRFALELKFVVDDMLQRSKDKEFFYEDYPNLKPSTLYLRVNHAKLYLLDEMDKSGEYRQHFRRIQITRNKTGIRLTLIPMDNVALVARDISMDEKKDTWKEKIDTYVAKAKPGDAPLHIKGLSLTKDEQEGLKESFLMLSHIGAIVMPNEIKIMVFGGKE